MSGVSDMVLLGLKRDCCVLLPGPSGLLPVPQPSKIDCFIGGLIHQSCRGI